MISSINFKGTYITPAIVKKFDGDKNYPQKEVALVELSPISYNDMSVMNRISYEWGNNGTLATDIRDTFSDHYVAYDEFPREKFYVLTEQKRNFDKLDSLEVLAVTQLKNIPEGIFIDYLQVAPDYCADNTNSLFRGVGSAFLNSIKKLYTHKNIILNSLESAVQFYKKNGFEVFDGGMIYRAK